MSSSQRRAYLYITLLFIVCLSTVAAAEQEEGTSDVCDKLAQVFQQSENKSVWNDKTGRSFSLLEIPTEASGIEKISWRASDEKSFARDMSVQYPKSLSYFAREGISQGFTEFQAVEIDVYNRGVKDTLYRVFYGDGNWRNFLFDSDPIRRGFSRLFNDNAAKVEPFIYNGEILFLRVEIDMWRVMKYKTTVDGQLPVTSICAHARDK